MVEITHFYIILSGALFATGVLGVLLRRNVLVVLMCIELMLNAANLALVAFGRSHGELDAQIFVIFVMAVAAAEAAVGLAIVIALFRNFYSTQSSEARLLRG